MKIGEITGFTVVSFIPAAICGGVFELRSGSWHLTRTADRKLAGAKDESALWRELWKELHGGGELIVLTGAVPGGVFFTFDTIALPAREQREALMMELPRQLLSPQNDPVVQFMPTTSADSSELESLNVYTVERGSLDTALATLRRARLRADELVHPLLMVKPGDPAVFLPGIDKEFCFADRRFHRVGDDDGARIAAAEWRKELERSFAFDVEPPDFDEIFPALLVARGIISGDFRRHRRELQLRPKEIRPVRFRGQLRITALLAAALCAVVLWRFGSSRWQDFQEYRRVTAEIKRLKSQTAQMRRANSASAREQKEMAKLMLKITPGGRNALDDLATISKLLPSDVMISDFRWNGSEIQLTLQSENENLDLTTRFAPRWKIADMQHSNARQSAATMIRVRLVPADRGTGRNSGRNGKGSRPSRTRRR